MGTIVLGAVKWRRWIAVFLVVGSALAYVLATAVPKDPAETPEFRAFHAARMDLPVRKESVALVAVGDIMLSRGVADRIGQNEDLGLPFAKVKGLLQGDIVMGNLEAPLTPGRDIDIWEMVLRADPAMATSLSDAGFTLLSLSNNHMLDFGEAGLEDTVQYLNEAGIASVGAGPDADTAYQATVVQVRGISIAILAFTDPEIVPVSSGAGTNAPGIALADSHEMRTAIEKARSLADFVIVSLHAGLEYESEPSDHHIEMAHAAVDAGADLVLGHHPHVVQKAELYRGRFIFYSLGNFVFDQWWSQETRQGLLVRLMIGEEGVERLELVPVFVNRDAQPEVMAGSEAWAVLSKLGLDLDGFDITPLDDPEGPPTVSFGYLITRPAEEPRWRLSKEQCFDLGRDGMMERFVLKDGRLTVETSAEVVWETPAIWWVDDFLLGDADNDGTADLVLTVWKSGSYGSVRPFWVTEDDPSVKSHLFVFTMADGTVKPVWQSSNLDSPNLEIRLSDIDSDGKNELIVVEGDYQDPLVRRMSVWKWSGWGFYRVSEPKSE